MDERAGEQTREKKDIAAICPPPGLLRSTQPAKNMLGKQRIFAFALQVLSIHAARGFSIGPAFEKRNVSRPRERERARD